MTAVVAAVLSLGLLGISPCASEYEASRTCTDLDMTVTAGGPGVLVPSCPPFTDAMEVSFLEQITFTSVPSDLLAHDRRALPGSLTAGVEPS